MTNADARFNKSHIRKVYACLAVTCHLHFWQYDRDFLHATVVTRGWNGYRSKSQHRKSTLEKKILPPFQQGFEPATFQSRVRRSNHWAIPAPLGLHYTNVSTFWPCEVICRRGLKRHRVENWLSADHVQHVTNIWLANINSIGLKMLLRWSICRGVLCYGVRIKGNKSNN